MRLWNGRKNTTIHLYSHRLTYRETPLLTLVSSYLPPPYILVGRPCCLWVVETWWGQGVGQTYTLLEPPVPDMFCSLSPSVCAPLHKPFFVSFVCCPLQHGGSHFLFSSFPGTPKHCLPSCCSPPLTYILETVSFFPSGCHTYFSHTPTCTLPLPFPHTFVTLLSPSISTSIFLSISLSLILYLSLCYCVMMIDEKCVFWVLFVIMVMWRIVCGNE